MIAQRLICLETDSAVLYPLLPALRVLFSPHPVLCPQLLVTQFQNEDRLYSVDGFPHFHMVQQQMGGQVHMAGVQEPLILGWRSELALQIAAMSSTGAGFPADMGDVALSHAGAPVLGAGPGQPLSIYGHPMATQLEVDHFETAMVLLAEQCPDANAIVSGYLTAVARMYSPTWMGLRGEFFENDADTACLEAFMRQGAIQVPHSGCEVTTLQAT